MYNRLSLLPRERSGAYIRRQEPQKCEGKANIIKMPPSSRSFTAINSPSESNLPERMDYFTLRAPPNTDLWRKPPSHDTCTSPILYTRLSHPFVAAEVTVSADWEMEWDQAGLVIFGGRPPNSAAGAIPDSRRTRRAPTAPSTTIAPSLTSSASTDSTSTLSEGDDAAAPELDAPPPYPHPLPAAPTPKWVKAGLEFINGLPHASSVSATSDGADWAMSPLPTTQPGRTAASPYHPNFSSLRIKLERIGYALWIWFCADDDRLREADSPDGLPHAGCGPQGWRKLREVTWFFWGVEDKCVRVGVYASRPANFGISRWERVHGIRRAGFGGTAVATAGEDEGSGRGLEVEFEGLEIF